MSQNEDEIEQEEVFTEREGTLEEKALNLVTQLKDRIKGFFYDESDGDDDDEDEGLNSSSQCIIDATESFEQHVADEKSRVQRSIVFLGHNGNGKSFLINLALQVRKSS
jgi:signal recognition particle GTPase